MITNVNTTFFVLPLLLQEHTRQDILIFLTNENASPRVFRFGAYMNANTAATGDTTENR